MAEQLPQHCLQSDTIQGFVEGWIRDASYDRAREHIERCSECRALVVAAARTYTTSGTGTPPGVSASAPAITSARYEISALIGAGGMGVVYQAYDVQLQRKVALKVLHSSPSGDASSAQARLLREARAMAQLSNPNVVHVYDVGAFDDQVFIAMELVEGETLRQWLRRTPRAAPHVAAVLIDAGRGLAAAHGAGLVHRDFKPDNVLIGRDGRARVTDFGVARELSLTETEAGGVVGTPAYMSPEQFLGKAVDARADQFSFCVAFYESIYGARPFAGVTPAEIKRAVLARELQLPDGGDPRLLAILRRGLSGEPSDRYSGMDTLLADLAAIRYEPRSKQRRRLVVGAIVLALMTALGVGAWLAHAPSAIETSIAPLPVEPTAEIAPVVTPINKASPPPRRKVKDVHPAKPTAKPLHEDDLLPFEKK